jgi:hypothetical protein
MSSIRLMATSVPQFTRKVLEELKFVFNPYFISVSAQLTAKYNLFEVDFGENFFFNPMVKTRKKIFITRSILRNVLMKSMKKEMFIDN